jgi:CO/xanthine dehydrogenase FAD-binding subunit
MLRIAAYHRPMRLEDAVALLAEDGRTIIAGGTDLLVNPRYLVGISEVVDIAGLGLDYLIAEDGLLRIGAGATMRTVAKSPLVQTLADGILASGAAVCGSPNIRNMATLAGNVASALPSADTPPPLLALDALVVLAGRDHAGKVQMRTVPLDQFFVGPARTVRNHELIVELRIPLPSWQSTEDSHAKMVVRGGYYKIGRTAEDIAIVNAAAALTIRLPQGGRDGQSTHPSSPPPAEGQRGEILRARIAVGAVAPTPLRVHSAEAMLIGQHLDEPLIQRAAAAAMEEARPISDHRASADYRRRMTGVAVARALRQAARLMLCGEEWHHA